MHLFVLSHGILSRALCETCEMIMGKNENISYLCLSAEKGVSDFEEQVAASLGSVQGEYLILCDIPSGTPFNVAAKLAHGDLLEGRCKVLCGVNLSVMLDLSAELCEGGTSDLDELAKLALDSGRSSMFSYTPVVFPDTAKEEEEL